MKTDAVQTPLSVNELFCPPEGAVQFQLDDYPDAPFWIYPTLEAYDDNIHCECTHGYEVVPGSDLAAGLQNDCPPGNRSYVCPCMGRILE